MQTQITRSGGRPPDDYDVKNDVPIAEGRRKSFIQTYTESVKVGIIGVDAPTVCSREYCRHPLVDSRSGSQNSARPHAAIKVIGYYWQLCEGPDSLQHAISPFGNSFQAPV